MTTYFTGTPVDSYTDENFDAAEAARVKAATDARITNADVLSRIAIAQAQLADLQESIIRVEVKLDAMTEAVAYVVNIAEQVKDQAAPTIDAITSSPMFKMLAGKGGRKNG